jgi:hypothetical protein
VDAPATVNGYAAKIFTNLLAGTSLGFSPYYGTPLTIGANCGTGLAVPSNCGWELEVFYLPSGVTGLAVTYQSDYYTNFVPNLAAVPASNTVVTSLDLEQPNNVYAMSWLQTSQASGFTMASHTILPSYFQTAATQEGALSRVITAFSFDGGNLIYISYGWQTDTATVYDVDVEAATFDNLATVAGNLATNGYIITAIGGEPTDGLLLVGTRVSGSTTPRPLRIINNVSESVDPLLISGGYAIVGGVGDPAGNVFWIGER